MAMYFYANKISAIACGTRCKQTVLQKSRGQRDRDKIKAKYKDKYQHRSNLESETSAENICCRVEQEIAPQSDLTVFSLDVSNPILDLRLALGQENEGMRLRRRHSAEQLSAHDLEMGFQQIQLASINLDGTAVGNDLLEYDEPSINFESSVLGSGGIVYINGRIVSGPLDSFMEVLIPKHVSDLDKEFLFSFLLSSRLFLRPHELLGKLLDSVPDSVCLERLVALLAEWTQKFPYDYRDEHMMNHVKHIVVRCSNTHLSVVVSQVLSALLQRLTDLERHEADLRASQTSNDKIVASLDCPTSTHYAQILCRLEKKLAKHIGPEEFLQCSSMVLLDKQKKWDQPSSSGGLQGAQDPKKTCNLETYLDWSARLRLFVCNEILQCSGIENRSKIVELWSGVAQYCLLVGNYNTATAILESLESPAIARLKITWSKLEVTCQQLDCMQRHAEGHGHLWLKQANEQLLQEQLNLKTDKQAALSLENESSVVSEINLNRELTNAESSNMKTGKPNDWVVIPVFSDIVKLALAERENCLQRLPNGHININSFDRMAAIVGAFTRHMSSMEATLAPSGVEYEHFCTHMQRTTKLGETDLMMASFECEEPNSGEKLMYDLN